MCHLYFIQILCNNQLIMQVNFISRPSRIFLLPLVFVVAVCSVLFCGREVVSTHIHVSPQFSPWKLFCVSEYQPASLLGIRIPCPSFTIEMRISVSFFLNCTGEYKFIYSQKACGRTYSWNHGVIKIGKVH